MNLRQGGLTMLSHPCEAEQRASEWLKQRLRGFVRYGIMLAIGSAMMGVVIGVMDGDFIAGLALVPLIPVMVFVAFPFAYIPIVLFVLALVRRMDPNKFVNGRIIWEQEGSCPTASTSWGSSGHIYLTDCEIAYVPGGYRLLDKWEPHEQPINVPYREIARVEPVHRWLFKSGIRVTRTSGDEELFYFEQWGRVRVHLSTLMHAWLQAHPVDSVATPHPHGFSSAENLPTSEPIGR